MSILGGDKEIRTLDPLLAKQVLYQLSYTPESGCKYISIFAICKFFLLFMVKKAAAHHCEAAHPNEMYKDRIIYLSYA